jgi:hypothetical protein
MTRNVLAVLLAALLAATAAAAQTAAPLPPDVTVPTIPPAHPAIEPQTGQPSGEPQDTQPPPDEPPPPPTQPPTPAPPAPRWQPGHTAVLQALDKVDGRAVTLTIPVGGQQSYRNLTIAVHACDARPPDQSPDSTANLVITETSAPAPVFTGWMLAAEPTASMLQDPVYDVRVLACQ